MAVAENMIMILFGIFCTLITLAYSQTDGNGFSNSFGSPVNSFGTNGGAPSSFGNTATSGIGISNPQADASSGAQGTFGFDQSAAGVVGAGTQGGLNSARGIGNIGSGNSLNTNQGPGNYDSSFDIFNARANPVGGNGAGLDVSSGNQGVNTNNVGSGLLSSSNLGPAQFDQGTNSGAASGLGNVVTGSPFGNTGSFGILDTQGSSQGASVPPSESGIGRTNQGSPDEVTNGFNTDKKGIPSDKKPAYKPHEYIPIPPFLDKHHEHFPLPPFIGHHHKHVPIPSFPSKKHEHVPIVPFPEKHHEHDLVFPCPDKHEEHVPVTPFPGKHHEHVPIAPFPSKHHEHVPIAPFPGKHHEHVPFFPLHQEHLPISPIPDEHHEHVIPTHKPEIFVEHNEHKFPFAPYPKPFPELGSGQEHKIIEHKEGHSPAEHIPHNFNNEPIKHHHVLVVSEHPVKPIESGSQIPLVNIEKHELTGTEGKKDLPSGFEGKDHFLSTEEKYHLTDVEEKNRGIEGKPSETEKPVVEPALKEEEHHVVGNPEEHHVKHHPKRLPTHRRPHIKPEVTEPIIPHVPSTHEEHHPLKPKLHHHISKVHREVTKVKHHAPKVEHHVPKIEHHVPKVEHHVSKVEHHVPKVEQHVPKIEHHVPKVEHHVPKVEQHVPKIEHHVPKVEHHVPKVEHHVPKVEHHVPKVEHHVSKINHHESKVDHHTPTVIHEDKHHHHLTGNHKHHIKVEKHTPNVKEEHSKISGNIKPVIEPRNDFINEETQTIVQTL